MRRIVSASLLAALAAIAVTGPAAAWDYPGHRMVGAIADLVLQKHYQQAHARVSDLLERERRERSGEKRTLSQVAVFPDCARPNSEQYCGRPSSEEELQYVAILTSSTRSTTM